MNPSWHIARKDFRRLHLVFVLWAIVITGHLTFATLQDGLDPATAKLFFVPAWVFGAIFLPVFSVGLTMGIFSDDSLADSDAFWITRPISGAQLLAAKAIVFALVTFFPVIVTAPWWFAAGYDLPQFATAALHTMRWNAAIMGLTVAFAVMSRSVGQYVIGVFALAIVVISLWPMSPFFVMILVDRGTYFSAPSFGQWGRFMTTIWYSATLLVLLNQFLTRRTLRSVAITIVSAAIAFTSSFYLTAPNAKATTSTPADSPPSVAAILDPSVGSSFKRNGSTLRVVEATPDFVRGFVVIFTEAEPDFAYPEWMKAPANPAPAVRHDTFFLLNRRDGHSVRANDGPIDIRLAAGTLRHASRELVFPPPPELQRDPTFNFGAWVKETVLVKISSSNELAEIPRDLIPADLPHP